MWPGMYTTVREHLIFFYNPATEVFLTFPSWSHATRLWEPLITTTWPARSVLARRHPDKRIFKSLRPRMIRAKKKNVCSPVPRFFRLRWATFDQKTGEAGEFLLDLDYSCLPSNVAISVESLTLAVQSISTFGNVRNNSVTSQHGGFEMSPSRFNWKL